MLPLLMGPAQGYKGENKKHVLGCREHHCNAKMTVFPRRLWRLWQRVVFLKLHRRGACIVFVLL
jgi:hypothetical protein